MSSSTTPAVSTASLFTPLQFTGISQYSNDFQSILVRAGAIAQLPVTSLQNTVATITQQEADLTALGTSVSAVGTALATLGKLNAGKASVAVSSDIGVVTATATGVTSGTSYAITNVTSVASSASETSSVGYSDTTSAAVSSSGTMQLNFGGVAHTITLAAGQNNLTGVVAAINALAAGVTASILTTGGTNGNFLSLSANNPGTTTLNLMDAPTGGGANTNLLTSSNQGNNTNFSLNGIPITSPSTTVSGVVPGMTLNFNAKTAANETVTLNVSTDSSQISSALVGLVSSYNALAKQEAAETGTGGGSLLANQIVFQIRQAMSSILQYQSGDRNMGNLANLGIEMSTSGQMALNQETFAALSSSQIAAGLKLLGSSTTGIGGLQQTFNQITDPITGSIADQEKQWQTTVTRLSSQITAKVTQIQANEQILNRRLQAADALAAQLASQQNILTASIASLNYTSYGYSNKTTGS